MQDRIPSTTAGGVSVSSGHVTPTSDTHSASAAASRRQLTMIFCDLVGSTRLSEQLDAEDYRELLLAYHNAVAPVVERFEGHIAQYLGDGVLIYFGHPVAHEDDAERAIRAGYDILTALKQFNAEAKYKSELNVRIGIHTGPVVVGQVGAGGKHETLALGESANLAAKLQSHAEPNSILISDATRKLVPGLFVLEDLGRMTLSDVEKPMNVYRVVQPSGIRTRLEAAERLTTFVNRDVELNLLTDRWSQAQEGQGQACLITAEAGLGKSRLMLILHEHMHDVPHSWLECRSFPLSRNSAYQPIIELLQRGLTIKEGDTQEQKLQRLERGLDAIGADREEAVPLLAPLLSLTLPKHYPPSPYSPELKRKKTIELLNSWILALSVHQPLALIFEDLHWADPSTLEVVAQLLEQVPTRKLLVLMTGRPEFDVAWHNPGHLTRVNLRPLSRKHVSEMLGSLTQQRELHEAIKQKITEKVNGVPLFIEEITKHVLESGQLVEKEGRFEHVGSIERLAIPATLQDSLMARLDRLGEAKNIAQHCAVIGREIPYSQLAAVANCDEETLQLQLKQLTDAELLYRRGSPPKATYVFKHALIQDTAYDSLLKSTRQKLHGNFAQILEKDFKAWSKDKPEVLASHFELAGQAGQAIKYYKLAAEASVLRAATTESLGYVERALGLLKSLPEDAGRDRLELELSLAQAMSLVAAYGYGDDRSVRAYTRALELCGRVNDTVLLARATSGLWTSRQTRGELGEALQLAQQMLSLGDKSPLPGMIKGVGHLTIGRTRFLLGQPKLAREELDAAVGFLDPATAKLTVALGQDNRAAALAGLSLAQWVLGYPDQAWKNAQDAVAQAESNAHPFSISYVTSYGCSTLSVYRRNPEEALAQCTAALEYAQRFGFGYFTNVSRLNLAVALGMNGRVDEGLDLLRSCRAQMSEQGTVGMRAFQAGLEAELCIKAGRHREGQAALEDAFQSSAITQEHVWEPELHRIKGELLLAEGNVAEAEASFEKALEVSRAQEARSLELRAAISLSSLWQKQNRKKEARELLAPIYGWFTEGFDTPDLKDARALLDALQN